MMFLNLILLGGAAAAVIPLIIHLLNRTRFKVLDWGAMHLLESAIKINSRRIQWQAWLLLLLRMLIPAILAICLARPVLTAWRTAAGGNQHSVVLIIDNSLSMEAAHDGTSCFQAAIEQAAALIEGFGPATELTILSGGGGVIDQAGGTSFDIQRGLRRLRELRVGAGSCAVGDVLAAGLAQLNKAKQPRRHLILLSDFQRSEWDGVAAESLATLRGSNDSNAAPVEITFIPVQAKNSENLSVTIERPAGPNIVAHQQPIEIRASIRNHGRLRIKDLPVVLTEDGAALASKSVDVAPQSQVFLVFTCQLQTVGSHILSVAIDEVAARRALGESKAALVQSDDISRLSIEVIEPVQVGIVCTRPTNAVVIDDAMLLNLALSPYAVSLIAGTVNEETAGWAEAHAGADPIQCQMLNPEELSRAQLSSLQVLALTNVPELDQATTERVAGFVEEGGALMIMPGDAMRPNWYNSNFGPNAAKSLMPFEYGNLSRPKDRNSPLLKIQSQSYEHPALTFFNRSSNGRLDSVDFSTWYEPSGKAEGLTLLTLENGNPLLVERSVGRGRVLQWTTSCDQQWSNLPLREVFVPLMQQLVTYSAASAAPLSNLETGQPIAVRWRPSPTRRVTDESSLAGSTGNTAVELLTPQGSRYRLEAQTSPTDSSVDSPGELTVQFARTQFPGIYQLSGIREQMLMVSVAARMEESDLTPLSEAALGSITERLEAQVQLSSEEFWEAESVKQTGREVWGWVLMALVACLFCELLLQQSLTRAPA